MTQQDEHPGENLKYETEAFNVECRNKIEDEDGRSRGVDLVWHIGEEGEKLELLILCSEGTIGEQRRQTEVKSQNQHSSRANSISLKACGSSSFSNFNAIGGLCE